MSVAQKSAPRGWMRGTAAPIRGALLGLVLERPGHGGDLANRVGVRLGETWQIARTDVYRLLEGLASEGLIRGREEAINRKGHGTSVVYHPTETTAAALGDWMETVLPREPMRRGVEAKLAVAREQDARSLRVALRRHEAECLALSRMIDPSRGQPRSWAELLLDCKRDGVQRVLQAEIDWAQRTLMRLDEYVARAH